MKCNLHWPIDTSSAEKLRHGFPSGFHHKCFLISCSSSNNLWAFWLKSLPSLVWWGVTVLLSVKPYVARTRMSSMFTICCFSIFCWYSDHFTSLLCWHLWYCHRLISVVQKFRSVKEPFLYKKKRLFVLCEIMQRFWKKMFPLNVSL